MNKDLGGSISAMGSSRVWSINLDNLGDYILVDGYTNFVVCGSRFDATLDDLLGYLGD
jgi:hypothetical protein